MSCPCGRGVPLEECCGRYLHGGELPETPEQLMRSRYTAYVLQDVDYLMDTQAEGDRDSVERWAREAEFSGLEVLEASGTEVEFIARHKAGEHHERSRFERRGGKWIYTQGFPPPRRAARTPGRNDPCPCGSGKKWKKCCGVTS